MAPLRVDLKSADGTSIAVWREGQGAPLVLIHGSLRDHTVFEPLIASLRDRFTLYAMDRRGYGASGDSTSYTIQQDFHDVAVVVDHVQQRSGGPVALMGHSYGAGCAMGAATITPHVHRLILYEPGLGIAYPPGWIDAQEQALAAGQTEAVVVAVLSDILDMSEEEVAARRSSPRWSEYLVTAAAVLREARTEQEWRYQPGLLDGITASTLILIGTESPHPLLKSTLEAMAAIPGARAHVLAGHGHLALLTDPDMVGAVITRFVND